jgi:hypothetical protein
LAATNDHQDENESDQDEVHEAPAAVLTTVADDAEQQAADQPADGKADERRDPRAGGRR